MLARRDRQKPSPVPCPHAPSLALTVQTALALHKSTLVLYDSDPTSVRTHVDLAQTRASAPPELRALFDGPCLSWPGYRDDVAAEVLVKELMELSGFGDRFCGVSRTVSE